MEASVPSRARATLWAPPLLIALATTVMAARSWLKWPDLVVDYGQQLYVAWRLAEGEVLYRDIVYFHGPLSSYVHAGVMRFGGVSLLSLVFFNLIVVVGLIVLLYKLLAGVASRFAATAACLVFVTVFAFAQYLGIGSYNYVCPYTSEITHGLVLALAAIYAFQSYARSTRKSALVVSGLLLGSVFLTKVEVFVAAAAALAVGALAVAFRDRLPVKAVAVRVVILAGPALAPPVLAWGLFCLAVSPSEALESLTAMVTVVFSEGTDLLFYRSRMGLDAPLVHLGRMAATLLWHGAVVGPALAAGLLSKGSSKASEYVWVVAWIPVLVVAWNVGSPLWLQTARPLPVFLLLLIGAAGAALARERRAEPTMPGRGAVAVLTLSVFALGLLGKILLNSRVYQYGFVLAMPATLLLVLAWLDWIPAWIDRRGGRGGVFRAAATAVLAVAVTAHLLVTEGRFREKDHLTAAGADAFWADERGQAVDTLLGFFSSVEDAEPTLVVVPDGIMLNYLARARSPVPYLNYVPVEVFSHGEERILGDLRESPPDYVVVVEKSTAEFGFRYFGQDYARELWSWIRADYETIGLIGAEPLTGRGFGLELMRRRPAE